MSNSIPQCLFKRLSAAERSVASQLCRTRQVRSLSCVRQKSLSSQTPAHEILSRPCQKRTELRTRYLSQSSPSQAFSSTPKRSYKSVEEAKSRYRLGVCALLQSHDHPLTFPALLMASRPPLPLLRRRPDRLLPLRKRPHEPQARRRTQ